MLNVFNDKRTVIGVGIVRGRVTKKYGGSVTDKIRRCETEGCLNIGVRYVFMGSTMGVMLWFCTICAYLADKSVEPKEEE